MARKKERKQKKREKLAAKQQVKQLAAKEKISRQRAAGRIAGTIPQPKPPEPKKIIPISPPPAPEPKPKRAREKKATEWKPSYRERIKRGLEKNPYASLKEIMGHLKPLPDKATDLEISLHNVKQRMSNIHLREKLGIITPSTSAEIQKDLKSMEKLLKDMWEKYPAGSIEYVKAKQEISKLWHKLDKHDVWKDTGKDGQSDVRYHNR